MRMHSPFTQPAHRLTCTHRTRCTLLSIFVASRCFFSPAPCAHRRRQFISIFEPSKFIESLCEHTISVVHVPSSSRLKQPEYGTQWANAHTEKGDRIVSFVERTSSTPAEIRNFSFCRPKWHKHRVCAVCAHRTTFSPFLNMPECVRMFAGIASLRHPRTT